MEDEPTSEETRKLPNIVIDDKVIVGLAIGSAVVLGLAVMTERRIKRMSGTVTPCAGCIERMRREQETQHPTANPAGNMVVPLPADLPAVPEDISPNGQYTEVVNDPEGRAY